MSTNAKKMILVDLKLKSSLVWFAVEVIEIIGSAWRSLLFPSSLRIDGLAVVVVWLDNKASSGFDLFAWCSWILAAATAMTIKKMMADFIFSIGVFVYLNLADTIQKWLVYLYLPLESAWSDTTISLNWLKWQLASSRPFLWSVWRDAPNSNVLKLKPFRNNMSLQNLFK